MIQKGDRVRVYPHGSPEMAALAEVLIISANQRSIAVAFGDKPPFANILRDGVMVHADHGVVMLAGREELDGKAWGPWVELVRGGHYEMEEANSD